MVPRTCVCSYVLYVAVVASPVFGITSEIFCVANPVLGIKSKLFCVAYPDALGMTLNWESSQKLPIVKILHTSVTFITSVYRVVT